MSNRPWVWVQASVRGPRGLPGPHPHISAPVPGPRPEWPQAADRAQGRAELLLRLFSSHQPRPRCPSLRAEYAGLGGKAGERHNQQTQVVLPALLTLRQTASPALFHLRRAQKDGLSPSPQEIWNGSILFLFSQQVVRQRVFSLGSKLTCYKWQILAITSEKLSGLIGRSEAGEVMTCKNPVFYFGNHFICIIGYFNCYLKSSTTH